MPSPLGHALASFILGRAFQKKETAWDWPKLFFLMFCGIAPDLDFIPGIITGELYRYHHKFSHSLLGAVFLGLFFWMIYGLWRKIWQRKDLVLILVTVMLHPILDMFVADPSPPYGCPLFMPFSDYSSMSPWVFFERTSLYESVFEARNLKSFLIELCVFAPWAMVLSLKPPRKIYLWVMAFILSSGVILCSLSWVRFDQSQAHFEKIFPEFKG
jgi:inner membrane protein